jgi:DNA invertase Pin-like site-specific DNA recombinase
MKFVVAYYRVSTARQGTSGLGLEAQRKAVSDYLDGGKWKLVGEFTEVESGKKDNRPQLAAAFKKCRLHGARLVIAKLDRLSRDAHFLLGLQKAGVKFVAADMPEANELLVGIMAVVAQAESKMISKRTKEAMAAAKARGATFPGNPLAMIDDRARQASIAVRSARAKQRADELRPTIAEIRAEGIDSLNCIARTLTERCIPTARGLPIWQPAQVSRLLKRIEELRP